MGPLSVQVELIKSNSLPKGFRFLTYEGRRIYQPLDNEGFIQHYYECILVVAPDELTNDEVLSRWSMLPNRIIKLYAKEIKELSSKELINEFNQKIVEAINELQKEIGFIE